MSKTHEEEQQDELKSHTQSLDEFFYKNNKTNLNNCDLEPVHYIGSMQPGTAILILSEESMAVLGYSENIASLFATTSGQSLRDYLPELADEIFEIADSVKRYHALLQHTLQVDDVNYKIVFHQHDGHWVCEFFPDEQLSFDAYRKKFNAVQNTCSKIIAAEDFDDALNITVDAVSALVGFSRVNIYKFQSDWSGKVVAEKIQGDMPSFLGLYFPATDIPKQSRYIMQLVPYRAVVSNSEKGASQIISTAQHASEKPFDLTWSLMRSVSPIHLEYLRNMGVQATFTTSLIKDGKLWGLIACHNDAPKQLPFESWDAAKTIATALMSKLEQENSIESLKMMRRLRKIEEQIAHAVREHGSIEKSLKDIMPQLRIFMEADGFAFQYGTHMYTSGLVPPNDFIEKLIHFASSQSDGDTSYASASLAAEWDEAKAFNDRVCGVLIEPVNLNRICHLLWFRRPLSATVAWAGKNDAKNKRVNADGSYTLTPRNSFETWCDEHTNRSAEWTVTEISSARELLKNMLDIVAGQLQLAQSMRDMEIFSFSAAHDLKAPLRHMNFALELMAKLKPQEDGDALEMQDLIQQASSSYGRIRDIIDGMSALLQLENRSYPTSSVDLRDIVDGVMLNMAPEITEAGATVSSNTLPDVVGNEELLKTLFTNLLSNAIQYRDASRPLLVNIDAVDCGAVVKLRVTDNARGIAPDKHDEVFKPFFRLDSYDEKKGSGLGLAICVRICESLGGSIRIDPEHKGPGTTIVVSLKKAA